MNQDKNTIRVKVYAYGIPLQPLYCHAGIFGLSAGSVAYGCRFRINLGLEMVG